MKRKIESAGLYLLNKKNEILLIDYNWGIDNRGWALPKGKLEEGEEPEDAAVREVKEETGYVASGIIEKLKEENYEFTENGVIYSKRVYWFLALLGNNERLEPQPTEKEKRDIKNVRWFNLQGIEEKLKYPHIGNINYVRDYANRRD